MRASFTNYNDIYVNDTLNDYDNNNNDKNEKSSKQFMLLITVKIMHLD